MYFQALQRIGTMLRVNSLQQQQQQQPSSSASTLRLIGTLIDLSREQQVSALGALLLVMQKVMGVGGSGC